MASYRIPAVENFDFAKPEEWPRWIRHFERFRQASGLATKTQEVQVSTLIYSMGDKAEDLLESFNLKDDEVKDYSKVKSKFEEYFDKRRNTIYERARFNTRKQEENETADEFIADLHRLAKHCGYGALMDELIRDRIVVGIKDREVSEKLQMKEKLTLDDAMTMARQSEAVKTQQPVVRGEPSNAAAVEAIGSRNKLRPAPAQHKVGNATTRSAPRPQKCTRCGKSPPHGRQQCPANDAVCHRCHKRGLPTSA
jgi:ElaB/YqjD/DUF883 family membrane-anchored ribosome-binding protein